MRIATVRRSPSLAESYGLSSATHVLRPTPHKRGVGRAVSWRPRYSPTPTPTPTRVATQGFRCLTPEPSGSPWRVLGSCSLGCSSLGGLPMASEQRVSLSMVVKPGGVPVKAKGSDLVSRGLKPVGGRPRKLTPDVVASHATLLVMASHGPEALAPLQRRHQYPQQPQAMAVRDERSSSALAPWDGCRT